MKTVLRILIPALALFVLACSSPLDKKFERETAEADFARIVRMQLIDSVDAYIMSHFMVEHELIGAQILELDATYRDILNESKRFWDKSRSGNQVEEGPSPEANNKYLKDLNVRIDAVEGSVQKSEWSHGIKYHLVIENTSGKSLKAVKGNFSFYDPFGDKIQSIEYRYLDPISPNEKIEKDLTLRIQNTINSELLLEYGESNPFTVKWEPLNILYN